MNIYLVRHGESTSNRDALIQGQSDTQLTILGKEQAKLIAKRLKNFKFDYIYSSPLKRAKKTANQINYYQNKNLILDDRLMNIHRGKWTGKKKSEMDFSTLPGTNLERRTPGGESMIEFDKRVSEFIDDLIKKHKDSKDNILIVSHSGVTKMLLKNIFDIKLNKSNKIKKSHNCAFYHIDYTKDKAEYIIDNCNKHITESNKLNNEHKEVE